MICRPRVDWLGDILALELSRQIGGTKPITTYSRSCLQAECGSLGCRRGVSKESMRNAEANVTHLVAGRLGQLREGGEEKGGEAPREGWWRWYLRSPEHAVARTGWAAPLGKKSPSSVAPLPAQPPRQQTASGPGGPIPLAAAGACTGSRRKWY